MNDYSIGALEALSWARAVLQKCKTLDQYTDASKQIQDMIMQLSSGAAVSFKRKTMTIEEI